MTTVLKGDFDTTNHGVYTGDPVMADNGQLITYYSKPKIGDYVVTIPFDKCEVCESDHDLTKYGFIKSGNLWFNSGRDNG